MSQDPFQEREAEKYANPIPSREFILEHLTKREKPASRDELAIELNIEGEEQTEALRRRLMRGIPLYQIDTLVDLINLVSLRTGHSIGGFDADKIQGNHLELGIGKAEEPFEGIGRGILNIEGLPVYRDSFGGIGTPTSDHERTKMDIGTTHILAIVNGYNGKEGLKETAEMIQSLLRDYAGSDGGELIYFE